MEDDPYCGLTTGGQENCKWDCRTVPLRPHHDFLYATSAYFVDPACLIDCFPDGHCGKEVIQEYIEAGGACSGSFLYDHDNSDHNDAECQYFNDNVNTGATNLFFGGNLSVTTVGIFSPETLSMLKDTSCILDIYRGSLTLVTTFQYLVYTSSDLETYRYWNDFHTFHLVGNPSVSEVTNTRFHPGNR